METYKYTKGDFVMSEKKTKRIVSASDGQEVKETSRARVVKKAAPVGNATGLRIGAAILWVAAIAFEVLAILVFTGNINLTFLPVTAQLIIALVLDLICVVVGSLLWKKANRIKPASKKNKFKFWLWNNMGVIVAAFAFIPFIIIALTDKKADKKTKTIAIIAAVVALLIAGVASYDFNPVSKEDLDAATTAIEGDVYWSPFGKVYHTATDCQTLNVSEQLTVGSVEEAVAANRTRLCAYCAKRDAIEGVVTDMSVEDVVLQESDVANDADETLETVEETVEEMAEEVTETAE